MKWHKEEQQKFNHPDYFLVIYIFFFFERQFLLFWILLHHFTNLLKFFLNSHFWCFLWVFFGIFLAILWWFFSFHVPQDDRFVEAYDKKDQEVDLDVASYLTECHQLSPAINFLGPYFDQYYLCLLCKVIWFFIIKIFLQFTVKSNDAHRDS